MKASEFLLSVLSHGKFHSSSLIVRYLTSRSSFLHLYPRIPKNTKSGLSAAHSPCQLRIKSLGTRYPSVHSGLWLHPIQWEWGNVGITYKLLKSLRYSHSFSPHWDCVYLRLTSLIERILPNSHSARPCFTFDSLGILITTWCDDSDALDT